MAKQLIKIVVDCTVKIDNRPGLDFIRVETERLYLVGNNIKQKSLRAKAEEAVLIHLHLKHPKLLNKDFSLTELNFVIRDGRVKRAKSGISIWVKDTHLGNKVNHFHSIKDLYTTLKVDKRALGKYLKLAKTEGVDYLFKDRYALSYDGENFTSSETLVKLEKLPTLMEELGIVETKKVVVYNINDCTHKVYNTPTEASKVCGHSASLITDRCVNVALNLTNIEGKYAFWFADEFTPGVSKPRQKVERSYLSIRVESVHHKNKKDIKIARTISLAAEELGISLVSFKRHILNRKIVFRGRIYKTLGSSCLLPELAKPVTLKELLNVDVA